MNRADPNLRDPNLRPANLRPESLLPQAQIAQIKADIGKDLPWQLAGIADTIFDLNPGNLIIGLPSGIGHYGEGAGTFAGDRSWRNTPGLMGDVSATILMGKGIYNVATPFGAAKTGTQALEPMANAAFNTGTI